MTRSLVLRPTRRGMAAASLFSVLAAVVPLAAHAQTTPAPATADTSAAAAFKRADADTDGKLSKSEAASLPGLAERFDALDTDRDGFLSMAEVMAAGGAPK